MSELDRAETVAVLDSTYRATTELVTGLEASALDKPSRCEGWAVRDVLYHQLLDAQRALRAFATPAAEQHEVDFVSYWEPWKPGTDDAAIGARFVKRSAEAFEEAGWLVDLWA